MKKQKKKSRTANRLSKRFVENFFVENFTFHRYFYEMHGKEFDTEAIHRSCLQLYTFVYPRLE